MCAQIKVSSKGSCFWGMCVCRSAMDASGGSMGRRWPRVTHAPELTIAAQWPQDAQSENRYIYICTSCD